MLIEKYEETGVFIKSTLRDGVKIVVSPYPESSIEEFEGFTYSIVSPGSTVTKGMYTYETPRAAYIAGLAEIIQQYDLDNEDGHKHSEAI